MRCPFCEAADSNVIDSRLVSDGRQIRRRRMCGACTARFTTYETVECVMPQVIKRDETRQPFDEAKLRRGLASALQRRPVSAEQVEGLVHGVMDELRASGQKEVSSRQIGELAMKRLQRLDQVAYVRFASVYRAFQSIEDFNYALQHLREEDELGSDAANDSV